MTDSITASIECAHIVSLRARHRGPGTCELRLARRYLLLLLLRRNLLADLLGRHARMLWGRARSAILLLWMLGERGSAAGWRVVLLLLLLLLMLLVGRRAILLLLWRRGIVVRWGARGRWRVVCTRRRREVLLLTLRMVFGGLVGSFRATVSEA